MFFMISITVSFTFAGHYQYNQNQSEHRISLYCYQFYAEYITCCEITFSSNQYYCVLKLRLEANILR